MILAAVLFLPKIRGPKLPAGVRWGDSYEAVYEKATAVKPAEFTYDDMTIHAHGMEYLGFTCNVDFYAGENDPLYSIEVSVRGSDNEEFDPSAVLDKMTHELGRYDTMETQNNSTVYSWEKGKTEASLAIYSDSDSCFIWLDER